MDFIREYILSIITIIIFSVILEIIMPNNNYKKYIKLVVGLLVMLVIIKPILNFSNLDNFFSSFDLGAEAFNEESESVREVAEQVQANQVNEIFAIKLKETIENDIKSNFGVICQIDISFDGENITSLSINTAERFEDIKNHIINNYDIKSIESGGD